MTSLPVAPVAEYNMPEVYTRSWAHMKMSIDVVILMDCTGSMKDWIDAAKAMALTTAKDIRDTMPNAEYRLGFVGYRDFGDREPFIVVPLSFNAGDVPTRLATVTAEGGGLDEAEDVAGGLKRALALEWIAKTKVLIHVADAPPHGSKFHDILVSDRYPKGYPPSNDEYPAGEPSKWEPCNLMGQVAARGIDYYFVKIHPATDKTIVAFEKAYTAARVNEEQSFMVLDLKVQGTGASTGAHPVPAGGSTGVPVAAGPRRHAAPLMTALVEESDPASPGTRTLAAPSASMFDTPPSAPTALPVPSEGGGGAAARRAETVLGGPPMHLSDVSASAYVEAERFAAGAPPRATHTGGAHPLSGPPMHLTASEESRATKSSRPAASATASAVYEDAGSAMRDVLSSAVMRSVERRTIK